MRKFLITAVAFLAAIPGFSQGKLYYSLPRTSLELTVQAVKTSFQAGPYAAYAKKYLGVEARTKDATSFVISSVRIRPFVEADPAERYSYTPNSNSRELMLQLTSQGLVAGESGMGKEEYGWKFANPDGFDYSVRPSNLTVHESVVYGTDSTAVTRRQVVPKNEETKAAEVAARIFEIRENKYKILVGDTDATYGGEAMKATIDALDKMEDSLMKLFIGSSFTDTQESVFEVVPKQSNSSQTYVAFRLSSSAGLVGANDFEGNPCYMEITPEKAAPAQQDDASKTGRFIYYRIPAICTVTLSDGPNTLLSLRIPVYQLGSTEKYPIIK